MEANNKTYSFTIAIFEYQRTIESLWPTVQSFVKKHPDYLAPNNALNFLVDSNDIDGPYNLCHFWSNFEIADMRFWRSKVYEDFFQYLDATGNFFYERWGGLSQCTPTVQDDNAEITLRHRCSCPFHRCRSLLAQRAITLLVSTSSH